MMSAETDPSETRESLTRFVDGLTEHQRSSGVLLLRQDDFDELVALHISDGGSCSPRSEFKFQEIVLIVIENPIHRFEWVDFNADSF